MIQQPIPLIIIHLPIPNVITPLNRPNRPIGIIPLHVSHQAPQIILLQRTLCPSKDPVPTHDLRGAEFRQPEGPGKGLVLLEQEAFLAAERGFVQGADGGLGEVGPVVVVELPDRAVGPGGGVHGVGLQEALVCGRADATDHDEEVWVPRVDGFGALRDEVVPVGVVVAVLAADGAQLVAQRHADYVGVGGGEGGHGG